MNTRFNLVKYWCRLIADLTDDQIADVSERLKLVRVRKPFNRAIPAAFGAVLLSACGSVDQASSFFIAPGKYDVLNYTCPQIVDRMRELEAERQKLESLIARAEQDPGGQFVSNIAYGPDYFTNRGELHELKKTAAEKNCTGLPVAPGERISEKAIR
jgi:hypothetical protein